MDAQVNSIVIECTKASDAGTMTFPEVVGKLMEAGVESYFTDLRLSNKIYYMPDGKAYRVEAAPVDVEPAKSFDPVAVEAAIREIQAQKIDYRQFCEKILAVGCVGYIVSLAGRRAVYFGRTAEIHVEMFPGAK